MSELRLRLTVPATTDLRRILAISRRDFGIDAAKRYHLLITVALEALMAKHNRAGVVARPDIADGAKAYHVKNMRTRVGAKRVRRPRHVIVFKVVEPNFLVASRILHDAMDLADHGPFDFSTEAEE